MILIDTNTNRELIFLAYKVIALIVGALCIYLGYKLFIKGIDKPSGDVEAGDGKNSIKLKNAAPGTIFCVFGAGVIVFSLMRGTFNSEVTTDPDGNTKDRMTIQKADSLKAKADSAAKAAKDLDMIKMDTAAK